MTNQSVRRISTLAEHRALLKEVLRTATTHVLIVSPFISSSALSSDGIPKQIRNITNRGVKVNVFTDNLLNRNPNGLGKPSSLEGISQLIDAGAKVTVLDGIHNKTLIRDDNLLAEGSFNWLSAVRTKGGVHQREERTVVIEGKGAEAMIANEIQALNNKAPVGVEVKTANRLGGGILLIPAVSGFMFSSLAAVWYTKHYVTEGISPDLLFGIFCFVAGFTLVTTVSGILVAVTLH